MLPQGRIIVSIQGPKLLAKEKAIICHPMTAGVIFFQENFIHNDLQALQKLVSDIQKIALAAGKLKGLPIFIDQEGGHIQRFTRGFTPIPAPETFGKVYDINPITGIELAITYGKIMAQELGKFGIISLCPLLDLLNKGNPVIGGLGRSFHKNPLFCTKLAAAFIEGMNSEGMPATAKHFPGHGRGSIGDSHLIKPIDDRNFEDLINHDLIPFVELIKLKKIAAIMPAHITYPKVDPNNTAGVSSIWLEELLRKKFGYKGVIVSDCLSMKGAGNETPLYKIKKALKFVDIAIICHLAPEDYLEILNELNKEFIISTSIAERFNNWVKYSEKSRLELAEHVN